QPGITLTEAKPDSRNGFLDQKPGQQRIEIEPIEMVDWPKVHTIRSRVSATHARSLLRKTAGRTCPNDRRRRYRTGQLQSPAAPPHPPLKPPNPVPHPSRERQ